MVDRLTDEPLRFYLGDPIRHPDALNPHVIHSPAHYGLTPRQNTLSDKSATRPRYPVKEEVLTAEKLANFLMISMQMALFKQPMLKAINKAQLDLYGSEAQGKNHGDVFKTFNPFHKRGWEKLEATTGDGLTQTISKFKKQWDEKDVVLAKDPKFKSLEALFTRGSEEIIKSLSGKFHNGNGANLSEEALKRMVFDDISNVTTAHPNGKLADAAEPLVRALLVGIFEADPDLSRSIAKWDGEKETLPYLPAFDARSFASVERFDADGKKFKSLASGYELLTDIWKEHKKPKKMTPLDERNRQRQWVQDMYDACPSYMQKFHELFTEVKPGEKETFSELTKRRQNEWGLSKGFASVEELEQMRPPRMRSWVIGDADGKSATQPETIRQGILESRVHTLELHKAAIEEISAILEENQRRVGINSTPGHHFAAARQRINTLISLVDQEIAASREDRIGEILDAKKLAKEIKQIKGDFEEKNVVFDHLNKDGKPVHAYSKLDVLYVNVRRCGDFFPQVEIRQNAAEQKRAMKYIGTLLKENDLLAEHEDINEYPEILIAKMKDRAFAAKVKNVVIIEYDRLSHQLNPQGLTDKQLFEVDTEKKKPVLSILRDKNLTEEEMHARQILGFFILRNEYSSAISSYVIAEAAQADAEFKKQHKELHPENMFKPEPDAIDDLGKKIVRLGLRDYRHLMALELLAQDVDKKVQSDDIKGLMKLIPLFEDPQSILNQIKVWQAMVQDPDILARLTAEAKPVQIYDKSTRTLRPMTAADYKKARQLEVLKGDEQTRIYQGPEWQNAGSDASGRGTTLMNIVIALARETVAETMFHRPVMINGHQAVILPKNHSGVGAGNPRSQDKINTLGGEVVTQTNQGLHNLLSLVNPALSAIEKQLVIEQFRYGRPVTDAGHDEQVKQPDYKGNGVSDLSLDDKIDLLKRCCAVVESSVDMVYSEPYTQHLTHNTHGVLANSMNHSAREAKRDGAIKEEIYPARTPYDTLRVIGAVNRNYIAGECRTETQVLDYFEQDPTRDVQIKNGVRMLSDEARKKLILYHRKSDYAANMLSGLAVVITYANFDNAWKMAGLKRIRQDDGSYAVQTKSGTHSIEELCGLLDEYKRSGKVDLPDGIHLGHLALADHDRQFEGVARHVYELYYRMQHGNEQGDLSAREEQMLIDNVKKFIPEKIYEVMPEYMQKACKKHKELIDFARENITEDHRARMESNGRKGTLDINREGYYNAIIHDLLLETGHTPIRKNELTVEIPAHIERHASYPLAI